MYTGSRLTAFCNPTVKNFYVPSKTATYDILFLCSLSSQFRSYSSLFTLHAIPLLFTLHSPVSSLQPSPLTFHPSPLHPPPSILNPYSSLLIFCICLSQKKIRKQMRLVSNRELSEERIKQINNIKRFVGMMKKKKKVTMKEVTAAPTAKKKLYQTKPHNRTLIGKKAIPRKMNSRLSQWKIIVSLADLSVFAFFHG